MTSGRYSDQVKFKRTEMVFLQNEDVSKFQECFCFRNKSPAGCTLTERRFWKVTYKFIVLTRSKLNFSSKNLILVALYHTTTIFAWKPKWSVWPIGTFSTTRMSTFRIQKRSYGKKLRYERGLQFENQAWSPKSDFWVMFRNQNDFWKDSGGSRHYSDSMSIYKIIIWKIIYSW